MPVRTHASRSVCRHVYHHGNVRIGGFTLIEIMVSIAIVVILAGLVLAVLNRAREKARQSMCASNLRQIVAAMRMYAEDHDGRGWMWDSWRPDPEHPGLVVDALSPYVGDTQIWFCPSDPWAGKQVFTGAPAVPHWRTSYSIPYLAGLEVLEGVMPVARDSVYAGPGSHFGGFNEAYGDGRVKWRRARDDVTLRPQPWPPPG